MLKIPTNFKVNLIVLACIIGIYLLGNLNHAEGVRYFQNQVWPSSLFVLVLYAISAKYYQPHLIAIITIEITSTITNLLACYLYAMAHKTAFIYVQYETIMAAMFIAELAIIMGVIIRDVGAIRKNFALHLSFCNSYSSFISVIRTPKGPVCKI